MAHPDIIIIGGGIAGLSLAWSLGQKGAGRVLVIEKETQLACHASGRNAAIWLPSNEDDDGLDLCQSSVKLLDELFDGQRTRWLTTIGAICLAKNHHGLDRHERGALKLGWYTERLSHDQVISRASILESGSWSHGIYLEQAGILDIDAICQRLSKSARQAKVHFHLGQGVDKIDVHRDKVCGVITNDHQRIACRQVVIAAGAWAGRLRPQCALPMTSLRRHLVTLDAPAAASAHIVWSVDDEVYFRPESTGLLASPCDEIVSEPGDCIPDPLALDNLARKLSKQAPALGQAGVQSYWACQRSFGPNREIVLGSDPQFEGLHWLAGLGGRGMSVGLGAGVRCANEILQSTPKLRLSNNGLAFTPT